MFKKYRLLFTVPILIMGLMVLATRCGEKNEKKVDAKLAHDFTLRDLEGKVHRLSDFKGKVVILDFWDTWCGPCRMEIPHFINLYTNYKDKGFEMIGVALAQRGVDAVKSFVETQGVNYLNLVATPQVIQAYGGIRGIPTTFVIDPQGRIYKKYVGYTPPEKFESDIRHLLNL